MSAVVQKFRIHTVYKSLKPLLERNTTTYTIRQPLLMLDRRRVYQRQSRRSIIWNRALMTMPGYIWFSQSEQHIGANNTPWKERKIGVGSSFLLVFFFLVLFLNSLIYRELHYYLQTIKRKEKRMTKLITALKITGEIIFLVLGGIELKESIEKLRNQRTT